MPGSRAKKYTKVPSLEHHYRLIIFDGWQTLFWGSYNRILEKLHEFEKRGLILAGDYREIEELYHRGEWAVITDKLHNFAAAPAH